MVRGSLSDSFEQLGWTASDDATFVGGHPGAVLARVIIVHGNRAEVTFSGGLVNEDTHLATGLNLTPVAGDWVAVTSGQIAVGTTTMLGASGAGKTSLLNAMEGTHAATADVRGDGQGRHTTTTRRLYPMRNGGVMLDVPGIRSLSLHATEEGMAETFTEIAQASKRCRFRDCSHDGDAGCAIAAAVISGEISARRLESWHAVQRELSHHDRRHDPVAMAEQQKQWKQMTKASRKRR